MKVKDRIAWQKFCAANSGKYERSLVNYAERWAGRMLAQLDKGKHLEEVIKATIDEPGLKLSNSQLAQVIAVLIKYWEYGETLERWRKENWAAVRARREI